MYLFWWRSWYRVVTLFQGPYFDNLDQSYLKFIWVSYQNVCKQLKSIFFWSFFSNCFIDVYLSYEWMTIFFILSRYSMTSFFFYFDMILFYFLQFFCNADWFIQAVPIHFSCSGISWLYDVMIKLPFLSLHFDIL